MVRGWSASIRHGRRPAPSAHPFLLLSSRSFAPEHSPQLAARGMNGVSALFVRQVRVTVISL